MIMSHGDKKRLGLDFIQRLRSSSKDEELFNRTFTEFAMGSPENRIAVAMSLLEIGADRSETTFDRNYALSQLALLVRTCGLRENVNLQNQLSAIIDDWLSPLKSQYSQTKTECAANLLDSQAAPCGALWAIARVNRNLGLEKCDYVIKFYGESEAGRRVRELRKDIERLNPSEK
jgi:hypothetical protein